MRITGIPITSLPTVGTSLQLYKFSFIFLYLLLNVLLVVLYVNQLISHLTHYQPAIVAIERRSRANSWQDRSLLLLDRWSDHGVAVEGIINSSNFYLA